jgi:hypothetical protein
VGGAEKGDVLTLLELSRTISGGVRARTADGWATASTSDGKLLLTTEDGHDLEDLLLRDLFARNSGGAELLDEEQARRALERRLEADVSERHLRELTFAEEAQRVAETAVVAERRARVALAEETQRRLAAEAGGISADELQAERCATLASAYNDTQVSLLESISLK